MKAYMNELLKEMRSTSLTTLEAAARVTAFCLCFFIMGAVIRLLLPDFNVSFLETKITELKLWHILLPIIALMGLNK